MKHNLMTLWLCLSHDRQNPSTNWRYMVSPRNLYDVASFICSNPTIAYVSWTNRNGIETQGQRWTWDDNNYYLTFGNSTLEHQVIESIEYASEVTEE